MGIETLILPNFGAVATKREKEFDKIYWHFVKKIRKIILII